MIRKALIPVAGLGARLLPLTAAVPKAMLPLPSRHGRVLPVIHHIVLEALGAVRRVAIIVSPNQLDMLKAYFAAASERGGARADKDLAFCQPSSDGYCAAPPSTRRLGVARAHQFTADRTLAKLSNRRSKSKEMELADAQQLLLKRHPNDYYLLRIAGSAHDVGTPAGYVETWRAIQSSIHAR